MSSYPDTCPECGAELIKPRGPEDSPVLVVGEFPGKEEINRHKPFVGQAGEILRTELGRLGIDLYQCRVGNLWLHACNDNRSCLAFGAGKIVEEANGKKLILLLGSDCAKYFVGKDVMGISGLTVTSDLLAVPRIIAAPNPAIVLHKGCGEFRLALERFKKLMEGIDETQNECERS